MNREQGKKDIMTERKNRKNVVLILVAIISMLFFMICCCGTRANAKYIRQIDVAELTLSYPG